MTELAYIPHERFVGQVRALAAQLTDWRPDFLVGIGRGGLVPAVFLSHAAALPLLSVDHSTGIKTFGDSLLKRLAKKTVAGKRILIVDDINDSGRTLAYLRTALAEAGGKAANFRIAVLIDNVRSIESVDYRAETIDRAEDRRWYVFPWEAMAPAGTELADESHFDVASAPRA